MKSFFHNKPNAHKKTIVIVGPARSGTSIVSSILHHSGVYMGDYGNSYQYEDTQLNYGNWTGKIEEEKIRNFRKIILQRNENYKIWGWKDTNIIHYLPKIRGALVNPVLLFTSRSPLDIARSAEEKDKSHHKVPENYLQICYRSSIGSMSKQFPYMRRNATFAVLDFEELRSKKVTKPLLDWLGINYNAKCDEAIGKSYMKKLF